MKNCLQVIVNCVNCLVRWQALAALGLLCVLMSSFLGAPVGAVSQGNTKNSQPRAKTLVCVVSGEGESELSLDAVVIVERGKLGLPYAEDKEGERTRFAKEYFAAGRRYRLTFGGGDAGTATINKWDTGCNNIHATVDVKASVKLTGPIKALATNSDTLGSRATARRAPTSAERAAAMRVVKQIYSARGTPRPLLQRITTTNLTATDLNGDGSYELVGSFVIATPNKLRRDLFLIVQPAGSSYKTALVDYQAYKLPPEGFDSAIDFVDQLDLDGDGIGEVFAIQGGFDAYGYSIYKQQNGRWRKVFTVIGDAC